MHRHYFYLAAQTEKINNIFRVTVLFLNDYNQNVWFVFMFSLKSFFIKSQITSNVNTHNCLIPFVILSESELPVIVTQHTTSHNEM